MVAQTAWVSSKSGWKDVVDENREHLLVSAAPDGWQSPGLASWSRGCTDAPIGCTAFEAHTRLI